jgi:hypothetical protein
MTHRCKRTHFEKERRMNIQDRQRERDATSPTIARIWRGRTRREDAEAYLPYLLEVGIRPLQEKALGVQLFREDRADETEFITISYWENVAAMTRFTGGDPTRIHHLERDAEFLIELPQGVQVLEIVVASGGCKADAAS